MTDKRRKVGQAGEEAAREYLRKIGYKIIAANYRCPLGEIDIVALDNKVIVIIEVRSKTNIKFGLPEESLTPAKARRLKRLALYYLQFKTGQEVKCRIDFIAVLLNENDLTVLNLKHIRGILSD